MRSGWNGTVYCILTGPLGGEPPRHDEEPRKGNDDHGLAPSLRRRSRLSHRALRSGVPMYRTHSSTMALGTAVKPTRPNRSMAPYDARDPIVSIQAFELSGKPTIGSLGHSSFV